ncbi:hypothetical protein ACW9HR_16035 [Nocardia gipuzkoensis]
MADTRGEVRFRRLKTPRSAAVAGIVFAVLFASGVVLLHSALSDTASTDTPWVRDESRFAAALILAPFAGIAFLWFIGVMRDHFGELEDRFFSTVFLGSGLLFLATTFVSMAVAGGVLAVSRQPSASDDAIFFFGREVMVQLDNVYGARMAGVFMMVLGTIWLRTGLMPRWLVIITYVLALALLLAISRVWAVALVFPAWVLMTSVYILLTNRLESHHPR